MLQSGDKVPADLRLFSDKSLHIGEFLPVTKQSAPLKQHLALGDRHRMAYSVTLLAMANDEALWSAPVNAISTRY